MEKSINVNLNAAKKALTEGELHLLNVLLLKVGEYKQTNKISLN